MYLELIRLLFRSQARSHIWISVNQIDGCRLHSVKGGSWLACDGINWLCLIDRGACIAGKPAPTEKQKHCGTGGRTRSKCGSWLASDGINWLCLIDRGVCIAGKPAPKEKRSTAVMAN